MQQRNNQKIKVNQETNVSIPRIEYIPTDKRMWNSIKRRVAISDKIFDFKDLVLIFIGAVSGGWVSYFSVDEKIKPDYRHWLILLSVGAIVSLIIFFWTKKHKKEFTDTILQDMNEIENGC